MKNAFLSYVEPLVSSVTASEKTRLQKYKETLIERNHQLGGHINGFFYMGKRFTMSSGKYLKLSKAQLGPVQEAMIPQVVEYQKDIQQTDHDKSRLRSALSVVLSKCESNQDVRDSLPDFYFQDFPMGSITRTRPVGFMLEGNSLLMEQFNEANEIALKYLANRLLFS